jgi:hypothetical protein
MPSLEQEYNTHLRCGRIMSISTSASSLRLQEVGGASLCSYIHAECGCRILPPHPGSILLGPITPLQVRRLNSISISIVTRRHLPEHPQRLAMGLCRSPGCVQGSSSDQFTDWRKIIFSELRWGELWDNCNLWWVKQVVVHFRRHKISHKGWYSIMRNSTCHTCPWNLSLRVMEYRRLIWVIL